jgi:hypothetical protein
VRLAVSIILPIIWALIAIAVAWSLADDVRSLDRRPEPTRIGEPPSNITVFWPEK